MITCDFFGGLGNNLFQLATVYAIHKKYGYELAIPPYVNRGNIGAFGQETQLEFSRLFENEFKYNNNLHFPKYHHLDTNAELSDFSYTEFPIWDNTCYAGYFQSEKYFLGVDISKEFKLRQENIDKILTRYADLFKKKTISLHYRLGGDRVLSHMQHYHKNVSIDFYNKAISLIEDYSPETHNILVFSDKMQMCKDILEEFSYPLYYIEGTNNIEDFTAMALCNINIVGNSTFSWWAAYMNQNQDKKVIATKSEWFGPGYAHYNLSDLFPSSWITI